MLTAAFVPSPHYHHTLLFLSSATPPLLPARPPYFRPTRKSAMSSLEIEPARGRPASISVAAAQVEPLTQNNTNTATSPSDKEDDTYSDIKMSILSNAFFLGGGIAYIVGTSWDWVLQGAQIDGGINRLHLFLYQSIWFLGPLIYLLNAVVDVTWAMRASRKLKRRRALLKLKHSTSSGLSSAATSPASVDTADKINNTATSELLCADSLPCDVSTQKKFRAKSRKFIRRIRRHFGHRRELSAALTFGFAALFAVAAAIPSILKLYGETLVVRFNAASVHLYLVSAIFSVCGSRSTPTPSPPGATALPWWENADTLESIGDAFFFVASMVDVILADFSFDDAILAWPIASSLLWFGDALLYLRADFVSLYDTNRREEIKTINGIFHGFDDCKGPESPKHRIHSPHFVSLVQGPDADRNNFV